MATEKTVLQGPGPWRFCLVSGKDFQQPLGISCIIPGSKYALANLCTGDIIAAINRENASNMMHLEAQNKINYCIDNMILIVTSEYKIWSALVTEEKKYHPSKMNLASELQEVPHIGSAHNQGATPFTTLPASNNAHRVIKKQYNNPMDLYASENISSFNSSVEPKTTASQEEGNGRPLDHSQQSGNLMIDKQTEIYKMLQDKQKLNERTKKSTSILVLQEILESEKGDPSKPSGFRSVKAPFTKVAASIGNAQKLPICDKCGTGIAGVFVNLQNHHCQPECYMCTDCGTNLKQQGHFFIEDQIYWEKHAWEEVTPPEGHDRVTMFPT